MADLVLYWWCHKDGTNAGTVTGTGTRIDGGPYRSRERAREAARFWLSREGSHGSEYVILGTPVTSVESGDALDGGEVPDHG